MYPSCQGYQFWTRADDGGYFTINHIHAGDYNLYAWVHGFIGDYRCDALININQGIISCICNDPSISLYTIIVSQVEKQDLALKWATSYMNLQEMGPHFGK